QLESEGLLEQRAKQGTYIRRPDRHELEEIYQVRILLEPYAAGEAAQRCTAADLRDLQGLLRSMSDALAQSRLLSSEADRERLLQDYAAKDAAFHEMIVRAGGNRRIAKTVTDANVLAIAMSFPKDSPQGALHSMVRAHREHRKILQAI